VTKRRIRGLAIAACFAATSADAQGPPPFDIVPARSAQSAALHVNLSDPQAFQVGLDAFGAASGENEQADASDGGRVLIATSAIDDDTFCDDGSNPEHDFAVLYWDSPYDSSDPVPVGADRSDFSQEMFYEIDGTGCAAAPDPPLYAIAASSHDLGAGTIDVRAHAATNAYGYDSFSGTSGHGHFAEAQATAALADWVYVTGPNPIATVVLVASFDASFDFVPMPLNDSDWFSEAFDEDIRLLDPCGGYERPDFSGDAERPEGVESSELALNLSLRDDFVSEEICDEPPEGTPVCFTQWSSTSHGETAYRSDAVIYEWVDGEAPNDADCSDDVLEANREEEGSLPGSVSVQVDVATNQWIQVRTSLHVASSCDTPLLCDLSDSTGGPTQLSITSPDGTLVAWHGIAGLTRVPEPAAASLAAIFVLAGLARSRRARMSRDSAIRERRGGIR
jgi:hypothetical protein